MTFHLARAVPIARLLPTVTSPSIVQGVIYFACDNRIVQISDNAMRVVSAVLDLVVVYDGRANADYYCRAGYAFIV